MLTRGLTFFPVKKPVQINCVCADNVRISLCECVLFFSNIMPKISYV